MNYDKQRLGGLLRTILAHTSQDYADPGRYRRHKILGGSGTQISFTSPRGAFLGRVEEGQGPTLMIVDEGVDAYDDFVDETTKDCEMRDLVGRGAVEKQLNLLIRISTEKPSDVDNVELIRTMLLKPLRDNIEYWDAFVPIVNLQVQESLILGDVEFVPSPHMRQTCRNFLKYHRFGSDDPLQQHEQREAVFSQIDESVNRASSFAKVKLRSHSGRVGEIADDKALLAINTLRALVHLFYRYDHNAVFGLASEVSPGVSLTVSLGQNEDKNFNIIDL